MRALILQHHSPAEWAAAIAARLEALGCSGAFIGQATRQILERSRLER